MPRTSLVAAARVGQQLLEALVDPVEHDLRVTRDVGVERALGQRRAGEVGDREPRVRRAEVGDQHDAGAAVERQHGRRPAAGRRAASGLVDEAMREQRLDALRDGRAR